MAVEEPGRNRLSAPPASPTEGTSTSCEAAARGRAPLQWLKRAIRVAQALGATIIVEDTGYGRPLMELLEQAMTEAGRVPYQAVHAQQSKRLRAQDAAILAETGKLHLVGRQHDLLEDQMCRRGPVGGRPGRRTVRVG